MSVNPTEDCVLINRDAANYRDFYVKWRMIHLGSTEAERLLEHQRLQTAFCIVFVMGVVFWGVKA